MAIAAAKVAALVLVLDLAVFYFRLGWFLPEVWAVGAVLVVVATKAEWRAHAPDVVGMAIAVAFYAGFLYLTQNTLFDQHTIRAFEMTWSTTGDTNRWNDPEVVLEFVHYPGHRVGTYSRQLSDYLNTQGIASVEVAFEVTRDLWCMRGFHEVRIGKLTSWKGSGGGYTRVGNAPSPWGHDPWWCP